MDTRRMFRLFHELPENLPLESYRFFVFTNYAFLTAGFFHLVFIAIFAFLDVKLLSIYNIFSTLVWILCIYLNLRGYRIVQLAIANIEILIHAALSVVTIGWSAGFHYYILAVPLVIFLSQQSTLAKSIVSFMSGISYLAISYYSNTTAPLKVLDPVFLNLLNYANILGITFAVSYLAYYYRFIVLRMEAKIAAEHQKTIKALAERNEALDHLKEELAEAADYVKTVLPQPIRKGTVISDWEFIPSASLGGDAFGYHWLDKDHFAVYLLDVSGHGVGAALLSITIVNLLRSHALPETDFREPGQVLSALNNAFPSEDNNDMFFTIWYGVYNKNGRSLSYASAGHPPALLFAGSEDSAPSTIQLCTRNLVVGCMKNTSFQKSVHQLTAHSSLYLFSDGVYEFVQKNGMMWKYSEFASFLAGLHADDDADIERLVNSAKRLNQSRIFDDDFTILKISFR